VTGVSWTETQARRLATEASVEACLRLGWRIVPWRYDDAGRKRPTRKAWTSTGAITTLDDAMDWWLDHPNDYAGVVTGPESGIFVLDVDPRHGGDTSLAQLQSQHGLLPATFPIPTPSGGWHLYWKWPTDGRDIPNSSGRLGPGLDVRGRGGFVAAPGVVTERGTYQAPVEPQTLADAPGWLLDLAIKQPHEPWPEVHGHPGEASLSIDQRIGHAVDVPPGRQDDYLFRLICAMRRRGLDPADMVGHGWEAASQFPLGRPDEPWTREDVEKKVAWVVDRYQPGIQLTAEMLEWVRRVGGGQATDLAHAARMTSEQLASAHDAAGLPDDTDDATRRAFDTQVANRYLVLKADRAARALLDSEFDATEPEVVWTTAAQRRERPAMSWFITGIAPTGSTVGLVFGRFSVGKSFLMVDLALAVANGLDTWMGFKITPDPNGEVRHAGIILMEGAVGVQARINAWLLAHPGCTDAGVLTAERQPVDLRSAAAMVRLVTSIRSTTIDGVPFRPGILIVDTQGLATPGTDENSRTEMRQVYGNVKRLADEFDCLVLLVTHPGHQHPTRPAGSSTQEQDADLVIQVGDGFFEIRKVKEGEIGARRHFQIEPLGEAAVIRHLGEGTDLATLAAAEYRRSNEIIATVRAEQGTDGISASRVHAILGGNRTVFFARVHALMAEGRLRNLSESDSRLVLWTDELDVGA
jgi:Bifunctional DNA primase/polymerase, N-terminal/AAA domain